MQSQRLCRNQRLPVIASSPGHSQILSRSREEKSGEGLGSKLRHDQKWWTRVMWTQFRNDGNVPMHNVAS